MVYFPGSNEDDLRSLEALAAQRLPVTEALNLFDGRTPRDVAEKAYRDFLTFYGGER